MPTPAHTITRIESILPQGVSIVRTELGERFVLKLKAAGGGERGLITEYLGLSIARALGVRAPEPVALHLATDFPWQAGTDEFDAMVQRSGGWNLGVRYIPSTETLRGDALLTLPRDFLRPLLAADALLFNVDRTCANPNILRDAAGFWAIDFGACLFLNRALAGETRKIVSLAPNHAFANAILPDIPALERDEIAAWVTALPEEWLEAEALAREALAERLIQYLEPT